MKRLDRWSALPSILSLFAVTIVGRDASASGSFNFDKIMLKGEAAPGTEAETVFGPLVGLYLPAVPSIDESGHVGFAATLEGPSVNSSNRTGIWWGNPGAVSMITRAGEYAPDVAPALFASFPFDFALFPPTVGAGRLGFTATLTGAGIEFTNDEGLWVQDSGETHVFAREGDAAPGFPAGFIMASPIGFEINASGDAFFLASVNGPGVSSANDEVFWSDRDGTLAAILREGDDAPGMNGVTFGGAGQYVGTGYSFESVDWSSTSGIGIQANLTGAGVTTFNNEALWVERNGELTLLAREGDRAPGFGNDTFGGNSVTADFGYIQYNALEQAAFSARVGPTAAYPLFSDHTGSLWPVASTGDPAPGTSRLFGIIVDPKLSDSGRIAFRASFFDGGSWPPFGVWSDMSGQPGELSAIMLPGDSAPGRSGVTITSVNFLRAFSAAGLVFQASLDDPAFGTRTALYLAQPSGAVEQVVATGDLFDVQGSAGGGTDLRELSAIDFGAINDLGQLAIRLDFADDSFGFYRVSSPTTSVDGAGIDEVRLARNLPNPFGASTRIEFELARAMHAGVTVFDTSGRLVRRLSAAPHTAGRHAIVWDGRDAHGALAPSGLYWARIETGESTRSLRMVLMRRR